MGGSKKTAKGRLDKFYHLAKEQGYRARSAFKLIQLNRKYQFLEKSRVVVDLCAAPGSWLQVAKKAMPMSHLIIGVDLVPIKPIQGVITLQHDITTPECKQAIKNELKDWKVDVVLHDGAPNVGANWNRDAYAQIELVLYALRLATELLTPGGTFVTKVFRSKDYPSILWVLQQLFQKVDTTKPSSSRNVSAEMFIVCSNYFAPKKIDPKLLDPKYVFQDINQPGQSGIVNIYHPEKRIGNRSGYEDDATVLFKTSSILEFIQSNNPVPILSTCNQLVDDNTEKSTLVISHASDELKECFKDLKVLGRKEFKLLLKWRLEMRKLLELDPAKESSFVAQITPIEELSDDQLLQNLIQQQDKSLKKSTKKALVRKAKERERMTSSLKGDILDDYDQELFHLQDTELKVDDIEPMDTQMESMYQEYKKSMGEHRNNGIIDKRQQFFSRPIFKSIDNDTLNNSSEPSDDEPEIAEKKSCGIEFVKSNAIPEPNNNNNILMTPEGVTLALRMRKEKKDHIIEDSFNRYAFNDDQDLPSWFINDESMHNKPQLPITKEAVDIIKQNLASIQSRPTKKALEAKLRKKMRAYKHIQAAQAKANVIVDSEELTEGQKSNQIQKMLRNAMKKAKSKQKTTLVISKGPRKGIKGRPKGVKGRYKLVDRRMKKDKKSRNK